MKPIVFDPGADAEYECAARDYDVQRPGLGDDFRDEVEAALGRIRDFPALFGVEREPDVRACPVNRFPYTIFYAESDDRIWIAAVAHDRRRYGYWRRRRPPS